QLGHLPIACRDERSDWQIPTAVNQFPTLSRKLIDQKPLAIAGPTIRIVQHSIEVIVRQLYGLLGSHIDYPQGQSILTAIGKSQLAAIGGKANVRNKRILRQSFDEDLFGAGKRLQAQLVVVGF